MGGPYATLKGFKQKIQMAPLVVTEESPVEPVVGVENPPSLIVRIEAGDADLGRLNCFVQGDGNSCRAVAVKGEPGVFVINAEKPLSSRRNKYTLTAPHSKGTGWYWYSHLWINSPAAVVAAE
jgi:biofilm PGA synthesis lipoprotein PgaB